MNVNSMEFILELICLKGAYVMNLDEYTSVGAYWISLHLEDIEVTYFHIPGVEYVPKEIENIIGHNNIKTKIFRMQVNNSIMCGYFCITFIDFILSG